MELSDPEAPFRRGTHVADEACHGLSSAPFFIHNLRAVAIANVHVAHGRRQDAGRSRRA